MTFHRRYLLAPALAASLTVGLVACGDDDDDAASTDTSAPEETTTTAAPEETTTTVAGGIEEPMDAGDLPLGAPLAEGVGLGWLGLTQADAEAKAADDGVTIGVSAEGDEELAAGDVQVVMGTESGLVILARVTAEDGTVAVEGAETEADLAYVGLAEADAAALAEENGAPSRVISIDGESQAVTMDLVPERMNFTLVDGTVVAATRG